MIKWQEGVKINDAYVNEDGTITEAQYSGETPLSAHNLNLMQNIDIASITLVKNTEIINNFEVILPIQYQVRK